MKLTNYFTHIESIFFLIHCEMYSLSFVKIKIGRFMRKIESDRLLVTHLQWSWKIKWILIVSRFVVHFTKFKKLFKFWPKYKLISFGKKQRFPFRTEIYRNDSRSMNYYNNFTKGGAACHFNKFLKKKMGLLVFTNPKIVRKLLWLCSERLMKCSIQYRSSGLQVSIFRPPNSESLSLSLDSGAISDPSPDLQILRLIKGPSSVVRRRFPSL